MFFILSGRLLFFVYTICKVCQHLSSRSREIAELCTKIARMQLSAQKKGDLETVQINFSIAKLAFLSQLELRKLLSHDINRLLSDKI